MQHLPALLAMPGVEFADIDRSAAPEQAITNLDLTTNQITGIRAQFPHNQGAGMVVSVKEEKYDSEDIDLIGRTIVSTTQANQISNHATAMATLIGGDGSSYITGLGVAPQTNLSSSNYDRLIPDRLSDLAASGVSIQNHSYGTGIENYYGLEALEYDKQVYQCDTLIHVFSSGNMGNTTPTLGQYAGLNKHANLTGTFKQAKNVLVIGGTDNEYHTENLSSKGPAYDGRVKPEIVALGQDGTSGAAAITSGVACLLKQKYIDQFQQSPSAALIKCILINSADDIDNPQVDYDSGFGSLNALEAIKTIDESRFLSGSIENQQEIRYPIDIGTDTKEFKASITWNDPPAALNTPQALMNDLDIWLTDAQGNRTLPWVLNADPSAITTLATRQRDHLNNVEQVSLDYPQAGRYYMHVKGTRVGISQQKFHISHQTTANNHFQWHFPSQNDQLFADDYNYLRFKNTFNSTGHLSVSFDNGVNWDLITNNIANNTRFYKWKTPNMFTSALLKMSIEGQDFISRPFTISRPVNFNVGYNCNKSILLHWPKQEESTSYTIYSIHNNKLQPLTTTIDTLIQIPKTSSSSNYFAIAARGTPAAIDGLRGYTTNITEQGMGCYIGSLLANTNNKVITLSLQLGTLTGLTGTIQYQRQVRPEEYITIGSSAISNTLQYEFSDGGPQPGMLYYRVVLETITGSSVISDKVSVAYLSPQQFIIFPNPATTQLSILSGDMAAYQLSIYAMDGRIVSTQAITSLRNSFSIDELPTGIYICKITLNDQPVYQAKLIKQ